MHLDALAADAVLVAHLAFIAFVVFGGFLALRWPWLAVLHLPALAWGVWIELSGSICPLTPLENRLRLAAGEAGYRGGFVEHYLVPIVYPPGLTSGTQWLLGALLVAVNLIAYTLLARRLQGRRGGGTREDRITGPRR